MDKVLIMTHLAAETGRRETILSKSYSSSFDPACDSVEVRARDAEGGDDGRRAQPGGPPGQRDHLAHGPGRSRGWPPGAPAAWLPRALVLLAEPARRPGGRRV